MLVVAFLWGPIAVLAVYTFNTSRLNILCEGGVRPDFCRLCLQPDLCRGYVLRRQGVAGGE
jgi:hypothetical protein